MGDVGDLGVSVVIYGPYFSKNQLIVFISFWTGLSRCLNGICGLYALDTFLPFDPAPTLTGSFVGSILQKNKTSCIYFVLNTVSSIRYTRIERKMRKMQLGPS